MINIGLKVGSDAVYYHEPMRRLYQEGVFQYIELFILRDTFENYADFWKQTKVPLVLHAPHSQSGMNPANPEAFEANLARMAEVEAFAKALNPRWVILHGGLDGEPDEAIRQFTRIKSECPVLFESALIENKPKVGIYGERCNGHSPEQLRRFMSELDIGFCLDFGHAFCAAVSHRTDGKAFISRLFELQPSVFHVSDGIVEEETDKHLHLGKGNLDLKWVASVIPDDALVSLETKKDSAANLDDFEADARYFRRLIKEPA